MAPPTNNRNVDRSEGLADKDRRRVTDAGSEAFILPQSAYGCPETCALSSIAVSTGRNRLQRAGARARQCYNAPQSGSLHGIRASDQYMNCIDVDDKPMSLIKYRIAVVQQMSN
ncbi:unnamed protein product [Pleuronectes platessa]|uniref:Uncharacterized protein n=1 Tax=Pleuronectes platessa TaxID=8262 RepID=A0A9N7UAF5_PLEPL|nr:unnamed protein product [Pleuronectes platessa]